MTTNEPKDSQDKEQDLEEVTLETSNNQETLEEIVSGWDDEVIDDVIRDTIRGWDDSK